MKTFRYLAEVIVRAKNKDDAKIELINLMDRHEIYWELKDDNES